MISVTHETKEEKSFSIPGTAFHRNGHYTFIMRRQRYGCRGRLKNFQVLGNWDEAWKEMIVARSYLREGLQCLSTSASSIDILYDRGMALYERKESLSRVIIKETRRLTSSPERLALCAAFCSSLTRKS